MSNNRYNRNKGFDSLKPTAKSTTDEPTVALKPCCVCNKTITQGYYGRHGNGGTCSKKCEDSFKPSEVNYENFTPCTAFNGDVFSPR